MLTIPYKYQIAGVRALHALGGRALLGDEMGLGKTLQALLYAERHPKQRPVVVVCGPSIKYNWQAEALRHMGMKARVLEGTQAADPATAQGRRGDLIILNYDILHCWLCYLQALVPQLVILDESGAYLGNPYTRRTKAAIKLCREVPQVLALSGTPLENHTRQLWPTLHILDPKLFPNYQDFLFRYCGPRRVPWGNGWCFNGATNIPELNALLRQHLLVRRLTSEVMRQLPKKSRHVVILDLTRRREYHEAETDFLSWLAKRNPAKLSRAERAEQLVRLTTLKKMCGVFKLPALLEWLEEFLRSGRKLALFAVHLDVLAAVQKKFPASVRLDGSVPARERQRRVERFQQEAKIQLFLAQIRVGGVGVDGLQNVCSDVAFPELPWAPGLLAQAEKRVSRIGQARPTRSYYLMSKDTVEEEHLAMLQEKQNVISNVLDGADQGERLQLLDRLTQAILKRSSP